MKKEIVNTVAKEKIREYPEALEKQIRSCGGFNFKEQLIWLFHYYERNHTNLSSGSIVDYRKYTAELLNEDGKLVTPSDLGSHKNAAVSKYREFQNSEELFKRKTTEGVSDE